jgi:rubredoxin-NAD+ reductase
MSSAEQMAAQLDATVRTRTRVTGIDARQRQVAVAGESLPYLKLVLAIGAEQIRLPLEGSAVAKVMTVNSLDDYARFRGALRPGMRVAIIGAGLIGCEFANDLAGLGHPVAVIDIAQQPLGRLLPPAGGALMRDRLAALGVAWHFGTGVRSIEDAAGAFALTLANGATLAADLVLSAVGLKPKLDLAKASGLAVNRGIAVDRHLAASLPDIHALGDCAEVEGQVLPFVMPIMHAARALGATLAGKSTAVSYPAMPVLVKTPACPTIVAPPPAGATGEWRIESTSDSVKALFVDSSGKLLGFALNGAATSERAKLARDLPPVLA